jgi:thiosulfate/3-mercaptopyruvate sulfurtransferase
VRNPLMSADELGALLAGGRDVAVLDCRFASGDREAGRRAYEAGHIPGAVYMHLDEDLAGPIGEHGGRHPLPDPAVIAAKLGAAGVGADTQVVVYDGGAMPAAARCWWLLHYLGHEQVQVLDGGFPAWVAGGHPVTAELPRPVARTFVPRLQEHMVATMEEVRDRPAGQVVVDARSPGRFAGQPDPLDPKPGHIPGAVNRFWMDSLAPDGRWKGAADQAARFEGLPAPEQIIHQCGSGVTACANLLAMAIAGLPGARLYVGSWSDWCTYPENPVER